MMDRVFWHPLFARAEFQSVEIGVFQDEPQTNRLTSEIADIRATLPLDCSVNLVAENVRTLIQRETRHWSAASVLNLNVDAAGRRCREVDGKSVALEPQRPGDQFAALPICVYRNETVQSQCVASYSIAIARPRPFRGVQ